MWSLQILSLVPGPAEGGDVWQPGGCRTALGNGRKGPPDTYHFKPWEHGGGCPNFQHWAHYQNPPRCLQPLNSTPPVSSFLPPLPGKVTLRATGWRLWAHPARRGGHGVRLQSRRDTLPWGGSPSPGGAPVTLLQAAYGEKVSAQSQRNRPHRMIIKSYLKMRWGGESEQKPMKRKIRRKLPKLVLWILRPSWLLAGFEISVDNSLTIGPQKNQWNWDRGRIHLSSWGEIEGVILKRQIIPDACNWCAYTELRKEGQPHTIAQYQALFSSRVPCNNASFRARFKLSGE